MKQAYMGMYASASTSFGAMSVLLGIMRMSHVWNMTIKHVSLHFHSILTPTVSGSLLLVTKRTITLHKDAEGIYISFLPWYVNQKALNAGECVSSHEDTEKKTNILSQ